MCFRVLGTIVMALYGNMRHRGLEILQHTAVLSSVGGGKLRKCARRRQVWPDHIIERAAATLRKPAIAGVLQLLHAEGEGDISAAGGHRIDRSAKCFGA